MGTVYSVGSCPFGSQLMPLAMRRWPSGGWPIGAPSFHRIFKSQVTPAIIGAHLAPAGAVLKRRAWQFS
jgi:hypothetical protein